MPVQKRPFININVVCYCFDYYNLFDNVYRILQKNIRLYNDKYATKWSNIQHGASEELVADKFKKLMPNANIYVGNYYPETNSLKKMDENDIMVICDDIIIIAEVKAGSFTYTPAITDFEAHKKLVPMQPGDVYETYADVSELMKDFDILAQKTRIPKSRLLDEAIEDLLKKYEKRLAE